MNSAVDEARKNILKPSIIIANTIKGKGVSYMENSPTWHGSLELSNADFKQALLELGIEESKIGGFLK